MSYRWRLLRAGSFRLDGGSMFGVVPKTIWSAAVPPDEQNRIPLQTNCLLLEGESGHVLIECGFGSKWSDRERSFWDLERRTVVDALREAGVEPAQITTVIVTHLHFDHAGGLTALGAGGAPEPVFPAARVIVQKQEWEDALANRSTMTRTYLRSHLDPIAGQIELVDGEHAVRPGITVWPMPGHTWGQQAVRFDDDHGTVCFAGDVMPTVHHAGAAYSMGYDMLPYTNMQSKQALLERAAAEGWRLALDHEPGNALVTVRPDPDRPGRFAVDAVTRAPS